MQVDMNMDELERIGRQINGAYGIAVTLSTALDEIEGDSPWMHAATGLMDLLGIIRKRHNGLIEETYKNKRESSEKAGEDEREI